MSRWRRFPGINAGYQYAAALIHSLIAADAGLTRLHSMGRRKPEDAVAEFADMLKNIELAARDFDCAALTIQSQEKFSPQVSNELAQKQAEAARTAATAVRLSYLQLASTAREGASQFLARMNGSLSDVEFAKKWLVFQ